MRKTELMPLVAELQAQQVKKRDLVVPGKCITAEGGNLVISNVSGNAELDGLLAGLNISQTTSSNWPLAPMPNAHAQICEKLDLPRKYYDKMLAESDRLIYDATVNYWFAQKRGNYFLRAFTNEEGGIGHLRALLGDTYKVIDNLDVLVTALETVQEEGVNVKIEYCDLTETKMYVRFVAPDIEVISPELVSRYRTPGEGGRLDGGSNGICSGFVLSNSEVGQGKFNISPRAVVGACANGMIFTDDAFARQHLGSKLQNYSMINWSERTLELERDFIISQVRDAVRTFCSKEYLGQKISKVVELGSPKLEHPIDAVHNVSRAVGVADDKINRVLEYFTQGADTRRFGITQALTYFAQHDAEADQQYELETAAVDILGRMAEFDRKFTLKTAARVK